MHEDAETTGDDTEAADDDIEDLNDIGVDFASGTPHEAIGHWLECLSHWYIVLIEIQNDYFKPDGPKTSLSIKVLNPPSLPEPGRQATLAETIDSLHLTPKEEEETWLILKNRANEELLRADTRKDTREKWLPLATGREDGTWQTLFWGRVHCEATLACLMEGKIDNGEDVAVSIAPFFALEVVRSNTGLAGLQQGHWRLQEMLLSLQRAA